MAVERWNLLHPADAPKKSHVEQCMEKQDGPVIASTDYVKAFPGQIRAFLPKGKTFKALGTDGFGRTVETTERHRDGGVVIERTNQTEYLFTGEPNLLRRITEAGTTVRWVLALITAGTMITAVHRTFWIAERLRPK